MGDTDRAYEDIEYTTIAEGEWGGPTFGNPLDLFEPTVPKEEVIRSQDAYEAFFRDFLPNTPNINWEEEMVVAVALGERSSGGLTVEIDRIRYHTAGVMQGSVEIRYHQIYRSFAHDAVTHPGHAVRCKRVGDRYDFVQSPPENALWGGSSCQDWSALHDRRPPGAVLQVHGKCEFPTSGYSVELERSGTQGTNPQELFLELVVHEPKPTDTVQDAITEVDAVYQEETHTEYDTVTIRGSRSGVPVKVAW